MLTDLLIAPNPNAIPAPVTDYSVLSTGILALLGYAVVFLGIVLLMLVVMLIGKIFTAKAQKAAAPAEAAAPAAAAAENVAVPVAPGTAGQLKLYDVPPKTAAMLMAIVANKLNKPLNELRFISIKEVK